MSNGMLKRLRSLTLLFALSIGLLGQIVAAIAMPMPIQMPHATMTASPSGHSGGCPACPQQRDLPGAPAMTPGCMSMLCSTLPAVIPSGSAPVAFVRTSFPPIAVRNEIGLTIRPDLGPPRSIHHS
jgi:hypothetical protein